MRHIAKAGVQWRYLPSDFPPYQAAVPPVGEDKERALAQIFPEPFAHQALQADEALAQIHWLLRHEYR